MTDTETNTAAPMRLRAEPPQVTRLSRKVLASAAAVALVGIGGTLIYALQTRAPGDGGKELYSTSNRQPADGLAGLPKDYTGPVLGPRTGETDDAGARAAPFTDEDAAPVFAGNEPFALQLAVDSIGGERRHPVQAAHLGEGRQLLAGPVNAARDFLAQLGDEQRRLAIAPTFYHRSLSHSA